ncbi:GyrI-like domain-containing protein [Spirillospora sp. NPDC029432]|uniref:MerR family transcriptional regulator n=1 Tax=Spirillospora sp. NPDC029432 TaxID=3154599 RepID=UPI0034549AFC
MSEGLLPIGRFARLCRLSVKQLRHYDELGLLVPARTDPDSGYRYYRPDQARDALSIGLLRSLDVPLPAIGRVLAGDDPAAALTEVRDRMEADLERRRRALASLDRVLATGLPSVAVSVTREPARRVVAVRDTATVPTVAAVTSRCVARVIGLVNGPPLHGPLVGLFPLDLADEFTVGVVAGDPGGDEVLPGGTFAAATHTGPYDQIPLTAHALLAWCGDHGHTPSGALREVYLSDPGTTPPERLVTQLMVPLEEAP